MADFLGGNSTEPRQESNNIEGQSYTTFPVAKAILYRGKTHFSRVDEWSKK
jgi:hypothetical protein